MNLFDQYDGSADPFEGDQTIVWRSLPSNAKVTKATLHVTPVAAPGGTLFEEAITFTHGQGDLGTTENTGTNFAEVDFHKRRTLARVEGPGTVGANLQVDVGGLYIDINDRGAIRVPNDNLFTVPSSGDLPGFTVSKFKLTATNVSISKVLIRSLPTNLTARLGTLAPIWTHSGDLSTADTSADFSAVLATYQAKAKVENGFYVVPLVVHSDTVARLQVELSVEFVLLADLQPPGIKEVVVPFDFNTLPKTESNVLSVSLPRGAQVLPGKTTVSAVGAFNGSRIVHGVPAGTAPPPFAVIVSPVESQGQIIFPSSPPVAATAVDVLLEPLTLSAVLTADLRRDLDGKPDGVSLLSKPVEFQVHSTVQRQPIWTNVPLPAEFHFENEPYWLVLTSLEGEVLWSTQPASAGLIGVQHTLDGGLSWHYAGALHTSGPLDASFRLRNTPAIFQIPLHLNVGEGNNSTQVSLDRFQALGRVDFTLDTPDLADAMNQYLSTSVPPACPQGEHLLNGDFEQWTVAGDTLGQPLKIDLGGVEPLALATSPNGRWTYVAGIVAPAGGGTGGGGGIPEATSIGLDQPTVVVIDSVCDELDPHLISPGGASAPLAIALGAAGARAYLAASSTLSVLDLGAGSRLGTPLSSASVAGLLPGTVAAVDFAGQVVVSANRNAVYFAVTSPVTAAGASWIVAISCDVLEEFARGTRVLNKQDITSLQVPGNPTVLALSPDESQLYIAIEATPKVFAIDALSLTHGQPVVVADPPVSIDFTADGKFAVIATDGTGFGVQLIDTATESITKSLTLDNAPLALVVSPTEATAFALTSESESNSLFVPIDLQHMQAGSPVGLNTPAAQMVITPQGDRIYAISSSDNRATFVPIGARTPAEWFVTSDVPSTPAIVLPRCLPLDPDLALVFAQHSGDKLVANSVTAGLSQVVPVSGSCSYEFSFLGLSEDQGAVAEIFWLDQNSTLLRTDTVPITVATVTGARQQADLAEHLLETTSPTGAVQAEVRFTVPAMIRAGLAKVALKGTTESLNNTGLEILQGSVPVGWTLRASSPKGVTVNQIGTGIRLFNAGVDTAELVQSVAIGEKQPFALEFKGRALNPDAAPQQPRVELRWLRSDGSAAGAPTALQIETSGFLSYPATGNTPAGTASVEIALSAPPETGLEINSVSLQETQAANVPLSFISQAPGELRVSRSQVTYDVVPASPPPVPASGLATPTPPGSKPGDPPCDCYCTCCQDAQPIAKPKPHVTLTGRPMTVGACPTCGSRLIRPGGPLVSGAPVVRLPVLALHRPLPARRHDFGSPARIPPLSSLPGIRDWLSELEDLGITSLHELASVSAEKLEIKGLSPKRVAGLINRAKKIISAARPSPGPARGGFRWA